MTTNDLLAKLRKHIQDLQAGEEDNVVEASEVVEENGCTKLSQILDSQPVDIDASVQPVIPAVFDDPHQPNYNMVIDNGSSHKQQEQHISKRDEDVGGLFVETGDQDEQGAWHDFSSPWIVNAMDVYTQKFPKAEFVPPQYKHPYDKIGVGFGLNQDEVHKCDADAKQQIDSLKQQCLEMSNVSQEKNDLDYDPEDDYMSMEILDLYSGKFTDHLIERFTGLPIWDPESEGWAEVDNDGLFPEGQKLLWLQQEENHGQLLKIQSITKAGLDILKLLNGQLRLLELQPNEANVKLLELQLDQNKHGLDIVVVCLTCESRWRKEGTA